MGLTPPMIQINTPIAGDNVISQQELSQSIPISGRSDPNTSIKLWLEGGRIGQGPFPTVSDATGQWALSRSFVDFPDGFVTVRASASDAVGNTNSTAVNVMRDTVPPQIRIDPINVM